MISADKFNGSCNVVADLSSKICVPIYDTNMKVLNVITAIYEPKTLVKQTSWDGKCKLNSVTCISNQKWNNDTDKCERKKYRTQRKDFSSNPSTYIFAKTGT